MEIFKNFIEEIKSPEQQDKIQQIFKWIRKEYPDLQPEFKWNQPMFTDHNTFIIGFSVAGPHLAVAPETAAIETFAEQIEKAGYSYTKNLFRINWNQAVDYDLLKQIIDYNIATKADVRSFWR